MRITEEIIYRALIIQRANEAEEKLTSAQTLMLAKISALPPRNIQDIVKVVQYDYSTGIIEHDQALAIIKIAKQALDEMQSSNHLDQALEADNLS